MIKVLRAVVILIIVCLGGLFAARAVGAAEPNPLALWFRNPDGSACPQTCLFGITPGVTPYDDALKLLAKHPVTRNLYPDPVDSQVDQGIIIENDKFCLDMSPGANNRVGLIRVSWLCPSFVPSDITSVLNAAQISSVLGPPSSVSTGIYGGNPDNYYFDDGKIDLYLSLQSNLCSVPLASSQLKFRSLTFLDGDATLSGTVAHWRGFASRKVYLPSADASARLAGCHN